MLIAQFNYFIWPFIVLCFLNMLIMLNIWRRTRKMTRLLMSRPSSGHTSDDTSKTCSRHEPAKIKTTMKMTTKKKKQRSAVIGRENRMFFRLDSPCSYHRHLMNAKEKCSLANAVDSSSHLASLTTTISTKVLLHSSDTLFVHFLRLLLTHIDIRSRELPCAVTFKRLSIVPLQVMSPSPVIHRRDHNQTMTTVARSNEQKKNNEILRRDLRIGRDRKAARSLFILVFVFVIFLFPYVICATASTAGLFISSTLFEISFWLLWLNSALNPFLYPFIQIKYRLAYLKVFRSSSTYFTGKLSTSLY